MGVALQYSKLQVGDRIMYGVKFNFSDLISLYT